MKLRVIAEGDGCAQEQIQGSFVDMSSPEWSSSIRRLQVLEPC